MTCPTLGQAEYAPPEGSEAFVNVFGFVHPIACGPSPAHLLTPCEINQGKLPTFATPIRRLTQDLNAEYAVAARALRVHGCEGSGSICFPDAQKRFDIIWSRGTVAGKALNPNAPCWGFSDPEPLLMVDRRVQKVHHPLLINLEKTTRHCVGIARRCIFFDHPKDIPSGTGDDATSL